MPTVAELMADRAEMKVVCEIGEIYVEYRPRVITPAWQKAIGDQEAAGAGEEVTLFQPLRDSVISWDLEVRSGTAYGLTDEELATIPRQILNQILFSLVTTARPNQMKPPVLSTGGSLAPSTLTTKPVSISKHARTGSD